MKALTDKQQKQIEGGVPGWYFQYYEWHKKRKFLVVSLDGKPSVVEASYCQHPAWDCPFH